MKAKEIKFNDDFDFIETGKMISLNKSQTEAIEYIKRFMKNRMSGKFDHSLSFNIQMVEGSLWVQTSFEQGKPGTLLHALSDESYNLKIGKRGKITAISYPKSLDQFKNKTFLGIHIK